MRVGEYTLVAAKSNTICQGLSRNDAWSVSRPLGGDNRRPRLCRTNPSCAADNPVLFPNLQFSPAPRWLLPIPIESDAVRRLSKLIEESTRATSESVKYFVEPTPGVLDKAKNKRHHIIFGRRGSGKSSLLHKVAAIQRAKLHSGKHYSGPFPRILPLRFILGMSDSQRRILDSTSVLSRSNIEPLMTCSILWRVS
jgi:hypothetical protein